MDFLSVLRQPRHEWVSQFCDQAAVVPAAFAGSATLRALYQRRAAILGGSFEVCQKRRVCMPDALEPIEKAAYDAITREDSFEDQLVRFHESAPSVSGRLLDSLVTKFPKHADARFFVGASGAYMGVRAEAGCRQVDISVSYKEQISRHTKTCFDPFGRGPDVLHRLKDGRWTQFSLCKFMFHKWAEENCIYDYLKDHMAEVARVQREDQQRQRAKKRQRSVGGNSAKKSRRE